jgi:hypothetical protein
MEKLRILGIFDLTPHYFEPGQLNSQNVLYPYAEIDEDLAELNNYVIR